MSRPSRHLMDWRKLVRNQILLENKSVLAESKFPITCASTISLLLTSFFFHFDNEMFSLGVRQIQKMFLRVKRVRLRARKGSRMRLKWSSLTRKKAFVLI